LKNPSPGFLTSSLFVQPTANATNHSVEWTRQLGTGSDDNSQGVSADSLGNVYISGSTQACRLLGGFGVFCLTPGVNHYVFTT